MDNSNPIGSLLNSFFKLESVAERIVEKSPSKTELIKDAMFEETVNAKIKEMNLTATYLGKSISKEQIREYAIKEIAKEFKTEDINSLKEKIYKQNIEDYLIYFQYY